MCCFLLLLLFSCQAVSDSLQPCGLQHARPPCPYCSWVSCSKNTEAVCHFFLWWTTFCQNSSLWPVRLRWPCTAWLMASLSYSSTFAITKLWFMHPLLVLSICMPFWSTECDTTFGTIRRSIIWLLLSSINNHIWRGSFKVALLDYKYSPRPQLLITHIL